ncbi:Serine/threonine-protein kinase [Tulasnella sp. 403]|nr:Serine/threonine-protein kinase [Tulasnella sp. 403]
MGNNISGATARTIEALDSYVSELGADIVYEKSLGSGRFLKTVRGRHRNGPVVIKIFIKPDPGISLRNYRRRLKIEREALADIPNVYSHQTFFETDKAGYIIRQWLSSSLYDRISTRPFLSTIEKKWIAFQILVGLQAARDRKVSHGDIKSENILVTSWNWVYITDFGSIKPVFLPEDDPTDYSFYFDTSGRRTCYLAPERFFSEGSEISKKKHELEGGDHRDGKINEAMDVFSAGCVIAEMFLEGRSTFTLSQLFKYRARELDMTSHLNTIEDEGIRSLVASMIALDPKERPSLADALATARDTTFPESFYSFMHDYIASVCDITAPLTSPASPFSKVVNGTSSTGQEHSSLSLSTERGVLPSDSDTRIERIWSDFDELEPYLVNDIGDATIMALKADAASSGSGKPVQDIIPVELAIPNRTSKLRGRLITDQKAASEDGPALIILSLVTANIRNCNLPSSKLRALDLFLALACHLTDEAKLDRLVPYVIDLLHDDAPSVRSAAIRTLVQVLVLVSAITPANASIFPEYILPNIRHLAQDLDVSVRCVYAQCIAPLADNSVKYLEMAQALKAHGMFRLHDEYDDALYDETYDTSLKELHAIIQDQLVTLLFDPSSVVKRAILLHISNLCVFFGRQTTNDVLLSHMITYLNDRDWMLRWAFFNSIVGVAAYLGMKSLEEYILPLMIQALSDTEEAVVAKVLSALTSLSDLSLFQKMRMWELMSATVGFLYHPNIWIRQGAAAFLASAAKKLPQTDVWCILYPGLRPHLRSDVRAISESSLLMTIKHPLPRQIFDAAVAWAMKGDKSQFWKDSSASKVSKSESAKEVLKRSGSLTLSKAGLPRSEEDNLQIAKLQQLGMTAADEVKLVALRDYILKLARTTLSFQHREKIVGTNVALMDGKDVELQRLGVMPHTVFLGPKDVRSPRPTESSRRGSFNSPRTPNLGGTPRMTRLNSLDLTAVDDLRRKLAKMDGSTSSLQGTPPQKTGRTTGNRRDSITSVTSTLQSPTPTDISTQPPASPFDPRMASPAASVTSSGIEVLRRKHQKAATAVVGSVNTNIAGVLEAPKARTAEEEAMTSGRTSPQSMAGTIRGQPRMLSRKSSGIPYTTYEGQEPGISNLLDAIYQDNFRDPTTDFGPRVHQGPVRKRAIGRTSYIRDPSGRRSDVTLVAHLSSHTGQINGIAVAPDHSFFVTCSDDKTVKVWDAARLERSVTSKARHTYTQHHAPVTCVCMLEASHCFASAANDGSLRVVRVQLSTSSSLPKYKQLQDVREHRVDRAGEYITCMTHYNTENTSNLVYATSQSAVVILDLRTMRILQSMEDLRHHGPITCMCLDRKRAWLLTGTLYGVLTLWDLRFGLRLKSWSVAAAATVPPGETARVHQCVIHPTKGKGRWVVIAVETQTTSDVTSSYTPGVVLVEVWDIEKGILVETFVTQEPIGHDGVTADGQNNPGIGPTAPQASVTSLPVKEIPKTPAEAIAALVKSRQQAKGMAGQALDEESPHLGEADLEAEDRRRARQVGIRAMVAGSDFGGLAASGARLARVEGLEGLYPPVIPENASVGDLSGSGASRGGGFLLTGSEDRRVRLWDLGKIERSFVVSGLEMDSDRPTFRTIQPESAAAAQISTAIHTESFIRNMSKNDRPSARTSLIGNHQQHLLKGHQDCVTALACIDVPFRCGIISGDRMGVVKVFRVETE